MRCDGHLRYGHDNRYGGHSGSLGRCGRRCEHGCEHPCGHRYPGQRFGHPNGRHPDHYGPNNGTVEINDNGTPDDITDDSITYTPNEDFEGTDTFEYTVCDAMGTCDTASVEIDVLNNTPTTPGEFVIEVNQMVTPNGDGRNDFLFIRGVDQIRNSTLKIFNRWGVPVYEGENYNNQNNVFDGRSRGRSTFSVQEYLPAGVYFYIFDYTTLDGVNNVDSEYLYISNK